MRASMAEIYKKWCPVDNIDRELFVDALHDDHEGMRIILSGRSNGSGILRIAFTHYYMYRNVDESNRIKLWMEADFEDKNWSLFRVISSNLIDWISTETGEPFDKDGAEHYFIKTDTNVIDIVTHHTPPKVEWLLPTEASKDLVVRYGKRSVHKRAN
jgi:hypothetical protein